MNPMRGVSLAFTNTEIKLINKVFHDIEAASYDLQHDEITIGEKETAENIFSKFFPSHPKHKILDVGSGTGFVPSVLCNRGLAGSMLVCTDISMQMLRRNRGKNGDSGALRLSFVNLDTDYLPFANESFDSVILSSVLHHLLNYRQSLKEIDRVLVPGGRLLIMHEPNKRFSQNALLVAFTRILGLIAGLKSAVSGSKTGKNKQIYGVVRGRLKALLPSASELTDVEIQQLVDIHSPTAGGGLDKERGFLINDILSCLGGTYAVEYLLTKNFLCKFQADKWPLKFFAVTFATLFPRDGYIMHLALKK